MEPITYSLKNNGLNSDEYYKDVKLFTDEVLKVSKKFSNTLIEEFHQYVLNTDERFLSYEDHSFELLMLGTLWNTYINHSLGLDECPQILMTCLAKWRMKEESIKPYIDPIRGVLSTIFLLPEIKNKKPATTLENLEKLFKWMEATGEFTQELKRLEIWKKFLTTQDGEKISQHLNSTIKFADWFKASSGSALGIYTINVNQFLTHEHFKHLWREDVIFTGRVRTEYHLNMVGAEIMNRTRRNKFKQRPRKALLLPGCIRSRNDEKCRAIETELGLKCIGCLESCQVKHLTELGDVKKFEVYIVTHESSAFKQSTKQDREELGIVGVACVSNLITGGWKADALGIPAQCVLLDYCGCQNHWHKEGIPTDINQTKLLNVFDCPENVQKNVILENNNLMEIILETSV